MAKATPRSTTAAAPAGGPPPVYALVGADAFLQLARLNDVLAQLPPDTQRIDVDGERADLAEVLDELRSYAMFGSGKTVLVRNADAFITRYREQLEDYLQHPSTSGVLILRVPSLPGNQRISKLIAKVGRVVACDAPTSPRDIARWVIEQARMAHRATVDPDAAAELADLLGNDLGRLDNEIARLAIMSDGGRIHAGMVNATVSFQRERQMWDMTNELAAGRPAEAMRRWRELIQADPSAEFRAVTWLAIWLEEVNMLLAAGRGGAVAGKLAWKYKDRLPQFTKTAEALGRSGHARALDLLAQVDHHSKSGVGDAVTNVERFILQMGAGLG